MRRDDRNAVAAFLETFSSFKMTERRSISWSVNGTRRVPVRRQTGRNTSTLKFVDAYDSNYAYAITWTPGTLVLSGDLGELTLTHWNAMPTIEATLNWLRGASFDYLMRKSDAKKEHDPEGTVAQILMMANEEAGDEMRIRRADMRDWWRNARDEIAFHAMHDPHVELDDLLEPKPARPVIRETKRFVFDHRKRTEQRWEVPDGWNLWHSLWEEFGGHGDPSVIFTAAGRRALRRDMESRVSDGREAAAGLCQAIGLDDFWGSERWPHQTFMQFAGIKHWAALADAVYFPGKVEAA